MDNVNLRFLDWIWHIQGHLPLAKGQSIDDAFDRLDPMFRAQGTSYHRSEDTLTFTKKDQAAQDKMSIFDGGTLQVEPGDPTPVLKYRLKSRALLACFIAPLIFLAFAQFTVAVNFLHDGGANADRAAERTGETEEDEEEDEVVELHPIDRFLGAPAPEQPDDEEDETAEGEDGAEGATEDEDEEEDEKMHSPTPSYVFAGIFALVYIGGRILEDRLIKRRFRRHLQIEPSKAAAE